jgi:hypothetical protein
MTALGLDFEPLAHQSHAQSLAIEGAEEKRWNKFTVREGFWTLGIVGVILMGIMLLALFGYVNFDMD